jgi:hypothetical protein
MNKTTLDIDENGNVRCLYTDIIDLYSIGKIVEVRKASNVEFNQDNQVWEVLSLDGQVLYEHQNRETAIEWEIENFGVGGMYYNG